MQLSLLFSNCKVSKYINTIVFAFTLYARVIAKIKVGLVTIKLVSVLLLLEYQAEMVFKLNLFQIVTSFYCSQYYHFIAHG